MLRSSTRQARQARRLASRTRAHASARCSFPFRRDLRRLGPTGSVVGIDREERSVASARLRATEAGYSNVAFAVAGDESLPADAPFDAAIGRFVLIHQRDPAAMIRRAAAVVRPGGGVAFLEPAVHCDGHSLPELELVSAAAGSIKRLMLAALPSPDVAGRMIPCFIDAGLFEPKVLWESVVPGSKDCDS
jgi:ubiquinone/menaquinone biosynthesis C-methylase UbiE